MHQNMVRIRKFEEKVADLVTSGEIITPCHLYIGQEAVATGVCASLRVDDYVFSTHRSHGHYLSKGGDGKRLMAELYCRANGCSRGKGGSMHITSPDIGLPGSSAIVAGTIPIAVGSALSFSIQKRDSVSVSFFGDGAVDEGVFYESLNFSALKRLPVIFICENNLYSTHMPISDCISDTQIYKKAEPFNMPGLRVDGNDAIEVFRAARWAVERARAGEGPALIECMTYRWRGHVGPNYDIDKGLRSEDELKYWMSRCPIKFLEETLIERGVLSLSDKRQVYEKIEEEVEDAVAFAKGGPFPEERDLSKDVFKM
jgi:pyruvate dehydrogenase E1 component alpha subunit